jgi:hypothetical protein
MTLGEARKQALEVGRRFSPPAPVPAPEVPHAWAAGMDALFNGPVRFAARDMTPGRVYRVRSTIGDCLLVTDDVGDGANVIASSFTPATAPAPAGEREWTPPGWTVPWAKRPEVIGYGDNARAWPAMNGDRVVDYSWTRSRHQREGGAPTLAQACCAALGIELHELSPTQGYYAAHPSFTDGPVAYGRDAEDCAKAALEAHARLEPAPAVESERG